MFLIKTDKNKDLSRSLRYFHTFFNIKPVGGGQ